MRLPALALSFALAGLSLSPPVTPPPAPAAEPAIEEAQEDVSAPEVLDTPPPPAPRAALAPALQIKETGAPIPANLHVVVRAEKGGGWSVILRRTRQLVTLRRGDQRAAGDSSAVLKIAEGEGAPLLWETTEPDALVTTRGTLRVNAAGQPALRLAEPPHLVGEIEERARHRCQPQDDGFGGVAVLCRVSAWVSAANLSAADPGEHVAVVRNEGRAGLVRFDFPASGPGVTAMVLGYTDGVKGVVVRAEQTFLPGEAQPSLTLLSDDRRQPLLPRLVRWHERWEDIEFF